MIRFATQADIDVMLEIYAPHVLQENTSAEYTVPTHEVFAGRLASFAAAGLPWLVWEEDGAVLGYAYAHRYAERKAFDWATEVSIYLAKEAGHRHIGTALYSALFALLEKQGYYCAYALVTDENKASIAFHEAYGFTLAYTAERIAYKLGRWFGICYLRYDFPAAACTAAPVPPRAFTQLAAAETAAVFAACAATVKPANAK